MSVRWFVTIAACGVSLLSSAGFAADDRVNYLTQIKPILRERCYACHGVLKQEGGLRLDTAALAIKGGESGAAVQPGDVAASLLLQRVSASDESERMPPEGEPLTAGQIAALRNWISQKATAPADEQTERDPRDHWAFRTPVRPAVPKVELSADEAARWNRNPIDAFIAREHQARGLAAQSAADKQVWLRRVSIDLVGLPPTPEKLTAFIADESMEAHDKVVTRLLDSPQYGQRWGRHWMDVWRYSDWWGLGAEVRNSQKHIWHWRDWIVESINADKGYDQMLREMLAADELYPNDLDRLRATGFLARQYFIFNRTTWLDQTVEHSAKAMLGLTFNCAKCHDHKYDPFSQVEYYQMRSLFEPYQVRTEMVPGQIDFEKDGIPRAFDAHLDVPTHLHIRGDDRNPDKRRVIEPAAPAFLSFDELKLTIEPVSLPLEATHPGLRPFVVEAHRKAAEQQIASARTALDTASKTLDKSKAAAKEMAAKELVTTTEAAAKGAANVAEAKSVDVTSKVIVRDDFSAARPEVWEQLTGKWSYENGRLIQSQTGSSRAAMRLKQLPPTDFEARVKYIPTGGNQWKSVGISCDVTADGNELLAYVSAVASGPRSQIAFKQGAGYMYPPSAAQARKVELNQPHEIVLRVRGTQLNMSVDGEHSIAFRLPTTLKRQRGHLELITFDVKVEFVEFELKALPTELKLVGASVPTEKPSAVVSSASLPVDQAQLGVTIAQKALNTAEATLASIDARAAADRLRHLGSPSTATASSEQADLQAAAAKESAVAAKKLELVLAATTADEAHSRAELALLKAAANKKATAEKTLAAAKTALEKARKAVETPTDAYTPLPGARKTQEDYQNRNAGKPFPPTSTGRRSALAKWLTDPRHPLPARVAVNHIWMRHMGQPLVPTVFDFGRKGTPPTHPELLDWLAVELVENNWSMKHIHRLIVTSETYRLSSSSAAATEATLTADPDNRFYWRMNPVRMEAQIVRDSLLHLAGELDLSEGGPSIPVANQASRRRSLYFVHSHNDHQKFLSMFDDASVLDCYRRAESIVPQQALALENSPLAAEMAGKIAARIADANPSASDDEFIRIAFLTVLSAEPNAAEQTYVSELLPSLTAAARAKNRPDPNSSARIAVIHALLNHNDFVTVR
jgi:hypothetical protein